MQNSLGRIFDGLEHTLRNVIAPTIEDSYILSQVTSVAEIIGNLAARVEWRADQLVEVIERTRAVLRQAGAELPPAPAVGSQGAELAIARDEHLRALGELQRSAAMDADLEVQIREFLAWHIAFETDLLRTASRVKK
jgi:hypothetical protein